jgi:hypothetical protein
MNNKKAAHYIFAGWIILIIGIYADNSASINFTDKYYYHEFDTDGTGNLLASRQFIKEVPPAEWADILAEIMDRASAAQPPNYRIIKNIIGFLGGNSKSPDKITWNEHLEKAVYAQAKSPDWNVRTLLINSLDMAQPEKARNMILSFQDDSDDRVRSMVLDTVTRWPDAEAIYQKYIQTHENDKNYALSIQQAKANLDIVHRIQKGEMQ